MASVTQHRVYIPSIARANQYILVEFKPTDCFYEQFSSIEACYKRLGRELFALCDEYELHNVHIITNNKLPVVRYHDEPYCLQTQKQMLFFYNPKYHEAHSLHTDETKTQGSEKIRLLFLATGDELRANAADFHHRVQKVIAQLQEKILEGQPELKIRDHQHQTYDLFAKAKGHKESYGYKLRSIYQRYQSRNCPLPSTNSEMTYVTFAIPVTRSIKTQFQGLLNKADYSDFYRFLTDIFKQSCLKRNLTLAALIANGTKPIIRNSNIDNSQNNKELQKLTFDCDSGIEQIYSFVTADELVDVVHFVIAAAKNDRHDMGFGKFMNQVHLVINDVTDELAFNPTRQELTVRFFQHINYNY